MIEVPKPWGLERWVVHTDKYAGKFLYINKGESMSKQYHKEKHETIFLLGGKIKVEIGEENSPIYKCIIVDASVSDKDKVFIIPPNTVHRIEAITGSVLIEWSTGELDDVVRIEDKYGRSNNGSGSGKKTTTTNRRKTKSTNKSAK